MSVSPRLAALVITGLLLGACGSDDSGGDDDRADGPAPGGAADNAGSTLVPEPTTLWVGSSEASALLKVDPVSRAVEEFPVDEGPWKVEYADGSVWVRTPRLQQVDPTTGQATGVLPEDLYIHDFLIDGDGVWVSHRDEPKLVRYDLESGEAGEEVELPTEDLNLENMTLQDGFMVGVNYYDGTAVRIDLESGEIAGRYDPDAVIWDIQVLEDSLWVAHYDGLVELDAETLEVRQQIEGVDAAYALAVDETGVLWVGLDESVGTVNESGQFSPTATVTDGTGAGGVDDIEVSEKSVWITHEDVGLVRLDRATNRPDEPINLPGAGVFAPTFDLALQ